MRSLVLTVLLGFPLVATAQDATAPIRLNLRPASEPRPALRYQFLPPENELTAGNAALGYYRAMSPEWNRVLFDQERIKTRDQWQGKRPRELPINEVRAMLAPVRGPLRELDIAARRTNCEWALDQRITEDGPALLLPELQGMRTIVGWLMLRARLELAEQRYADAAYSLQTGFALGRHLGHGPTLIHSLVGMSVLRMSMQVVEEWIDNDDSPNVYWAMTSLPTQIIDLRKPLGGELRMIDGMFPPLAKLEAGPISSDEAMRMLDAVLDKLAPVFDQGQISANRTLLATWIALAFPNAKKRLLAMGRKANEIDAMPTVQVVMLASSFTFRELRDDLFKWSNLSYPESASRISEVEKKTLETLAENQTDIGLRLYQLLVPAIERVFQAKARTERFMAMIRTIEAIRMHMAANGGKAPEKLEDITIVPVPLDPMTGKPFQYTLEKEKITLTGPSPGKEPKSSTNYQRYELLLVK